MAALAAVATVIGLLPGGGSPPAAIVGPQVVGRDPLEYDSSRARVYERAAAFGLSHVLYAKSPGGVMAAARRTARFRPLVNDAVRGSGWDADMVEAIVMLESAGRPEAIAGGDPTNAAGLTQIVAETATDFLGMRVDLARSRGLTRSIAADRQRGDQTALGRLLAARRRADTRFDPGQELAATMRYLDFARRRFGRDDLAVVAYHMGIGNLTQVLRAYTGDPTTPIRALVKERDLSWPRLYFDASPSRQREAWLRLTALGDDSQTYYGRVLAAREIMRLYRADPAALDRLARLHGGGPSAEQVLHPPDLTERYVAPAELANALRKGVLRQLPNQPRRLYFRVAVSVRTGGDPALYRAARPATLRLLGYLAARVHELSGARTPLIVTRAAYDDSYGGKLAVGGGNASHESLHEAGYALDIRRRYAAGAQAAAFQYTLERLGTLGLIAWTRDRTVIHITVAAQAWSLRVR